MLRTIIFAASMLLGMETALAQRDTLYNSQEILIVGGEFVENDTLFFVQEYDKENGGLIRNTTIFLETDTNSIYYRPQHWTSHIDSRLEFFDKVWLENKVEAFGGNLPKVDRFGLPSDWVTLHSRKGKPYVFHSCSIDQPYQRRLTDSLLYYQEIELSSIVLVKSEKTPSGAYHFTLDANLQSGAYYSGYPDLYIHILDERTWVAVWEYRKPGKSLYELMIPVESIKYFDLIVCTNWIHIYEGDERDLFEKVNAKALLDSVRSGKKVDFIRGRIR